MDLVQVVEGVRRGDRRAIARAISMVEDGSPDLAELSAALYPSTGGASTVGLTGSPGVGKSTLAAQLVRADRTRGRSIAVLAIDPTSPFSGGALLGDRVRMQEHATDPGVFIRSMATRGHLGGMALAAPEAIRILDAGGAQDVIVETVGVGQAELEAATATDTTLVVVAPGWGDAIQVAKAGILEIADAFVVNKSDQSGATETVRELESMARMGARPDWMPPVVAVSATEGEGIDEVWAAVGRHRAHLERSGDLERLRGARVRGEVAGLASELLGRRVDRLLLEDSQLTRDLEERRIDPYRAAGVLIDRIAVQAPRG